ncbi:MAG: DNA ligase D [Bryobacterales bacterium]|nr:DNA ligase D [Bryobacterales bacterium]
MALEEYSGKRSFDRTPEPRPAVPAAGGWSFCVQRHHASRLHYDFRVEVDGVLVSWSVPKGPSLVAGSKQLAVKVEDHPLDYGGFEGNIPKGNYGAGSVMLWDRGTYELMGTDPASGQIARGDFKFRLYGEKLRGEFALVRMKGRGKGNEWLLLKKKDDFADPGWDVEAHATSVLTRRTQEEIARDLPPRRTEEAPSRAMPEGSVPVPMPESVQPMLATLTADLPRDEGWLYEVKWDGIRALCFVAGGGLRIVSRRGNRCERQYPELSVLPRSLNARDAIVDGEIAVLDATGKPGFGLIQPRIMASDPNAIANLARSAPAVLFVFDLLYLDGYDLRAVPLWKRKELLRDILRPCPAVRYSEHFTDGEALFEAAREQGLEGVLAKRADSLYEARRSTSWLKRKTEQELEFVIGGMTAGEREPFGSLALGLYEGESLIYVGNAGSGFSEKLAAAVDAELRPLVTARCPFQNRARIPKETLWVRPLQVCAVKFHSWTHDNHLRAPVFLGLRPDLDPRDCVREPKAATPLLNGRDEIFVNVDGVRVKFTNLNKVFFPADGITKGDLIAYYDAVSSLLLPHLRDRPLSLKRYPDGIEGEYFFQKDAPRSFPSWMHFETIEDPESGKKTRFVLAQDRASLLYLANLGCIDQNPWMSRVGSLDHPDFILIDLDPVQCSYDSIVEAALLVREKLERIGLRGYPKTTGGDGMHIYIPVEPVYTYEQAKSFAEILSVLVAAERPALFTTPRSVARRDKGRVYFDYLQNGRGKTISAPYVPRAHPGAPVATPLDWSEVCPGLAPGRFRMRDAMERFRRTGDLFAGVLADRQEIEPALERLSALVMGVK